MNKQQDLTKRFSLIEQRILGVELKTRELARGLAVIERQQQNFARRIEGAIYRELQRLIQSLRGLDRRITLTIKNINREFPEKKNRTRHGR